MNERERLVELIDDFGDDVALCNVCNRPREDCEGCTNEQLADYLLENGVVVLPCSVNDTLYIADEKANIIRTEKVRTFFIGHPAYKENMPYLEMIRTDCHDIPIDNFGKTVFLTKEEAEQALKGGNEE